MRGINSLEPCSISHASSPIRSLYECLLQWYNQPFGSDVASETLALPPPSLGEVTSDVATGNWQSPGRKASADPAATFGHRDLYFAPSGCDLVRLRSRLDGTGGRTYSVLAV